MRNKFLRILLLSFLLVNSYISYATHVVGGTIEYIRLGPGALPNSSRYRIVLRLWKDANGNYKSFPTSVIISVRGDTLSYLHGFDDYTTTISGGGKYPYKGIQRMADSSKFLTGLTPEFYTRARPEFIRDFQISNRNAVDTTTVISTAITNTNANNNTRLFPTTGLPGYENPGYTRSAYPVNQYMADNYGYVKGAVTASGVNYDQYTLGSGALDLTKVCGQGRICVPQFVDSCTTAPSIYVQYIEFSRAIDLPNIPGGYHLYFQIRGRNQALKNLPFDQNKIGYFVYARIPDIAVLDNSFTTISTSVPGVLTTLGSHMSRMTITGIAGVTTTLGVPNSLRVLNSFLGVNSITGLGTSITLPPSVSLSGSNAYSTSNVSQRVRNSSPRYRSVPPLFVCQYNSSLQALGKNQNPVYDHSATDYENDSIVYSFAHPYDANKGVVEGNAEDKFTATSPFVGFWSSGTSYNNVNGKIFNDGDPLYATVPYGVYPENVNMATFNRVPYVSGYTPTLPIGTNALSGIPALILNSVTGSIQISPTEPPGLYVVSIKAQEFRRASASPTGQALFLGEITRDYQFNVLNCPIPAQALITTTGSCGIGNPRSTFQLDNTSTNSATIFYWDTGKDRYVYSTNSGTITGVGSSTISGVVDLSRIWGNGSLNGDAQQLTNINVYNDIRSVTGSGTLTPKINPTITYSVPGTYFVKLVVQGRGSKCADSVYQAVNVAWVRAGFRNERDTACVNTPLKFDPYNGLTGTISGFTTSISGSSLYTNPATNPIPMRPVVTIVGGNTITGFTHFKWMQNSLSAPLFTANTPPSNAIVEAARVVRMNWDFGNGQVQVITISGSTYGPQNGITIAGIKILPTSTLTGNTLSLPGVSYSYPASGSFDVTLTVYNQFGCFSSFVRKVKTVLPQPLAAVTVAGGSVCINNPQVTVVGSVVNAKGGLWSGGAGDYYDLINSKLSTGTSTFTGTTSRIRYKPTVAELFSPNIIPVNLTTTGNGLCGAGASTFAGINVLAPPVLVTGGNQTICGNNLKYALLSATVTGLPSTSNWKTKGTGTFLGTALNTTSILGDTYFFSKADSLAGSVTLVLSAFDNNSLCSAVKDSIVLYRSAPGSIPSVTGILPSSVCTNNNQINLGGSIANAPLGVWSTTGTGSFSSTVLGTGQFYTPSGADTLAGFVNLTLSTRIPVVNGGCANVSKTYRVNINPSPNLKISFNSTHPTNSFTACANNAVFTISGTVTGAGGGIWTVGSGSYNPGLNSPNLSTLPGGGFKTSLIYIPSASEITQANTPPYGALISIRLASDVNGNCNAVTLSTIIGVLASPSVTIGGASSIIVCKNNSSIPLTATRFRAPDFIWSSSSGNTSFTPSVTNSSPTYNSSTSDTAAGSVKIYLTANRNSDNCKAVSDTLNVTYSNPPTVNPGSDQIVCENNLSAQLSGAVTSPATGGIWSTDGTGAFAGTNTFTTTGLGDTYNPSAADLADGLIVLSLSTTGINIGSGLGKCLPVSKSINISFSPTPVILFGSIPPVNENNAIVNLTVTITGPNVSSITGAIWGSGSGSYSPSKTNFTYLSSSPLGPVLVGNLQYTPSTSEISAGSVTLNVTASGANNCNPVINSILINIYPKPTVDVYGVTVCGNNATINLSGTVTGASGGVWSGGTNPITSTGAGLTATYVPTSAEITQGFVKIYLTTSGEYNNAKPERDSTTVIITPPPAVTTGGNLVLCKFIGGTATVTGTITVAAGGVWTTSGTGSFSPSGSISGGNMRALYTPSLADNISVIPIKLTLTSVGNKNCNANFDISNLSFSTTPVSNAGGNQVKCVNDFPILLNASGSAGTWTSDRPAGGRFTSTGSITGNTLTDSYTPTSVPGVIRLSWITNATASCPPVSSSLNVTVLSAPTVSLGPNITICGSNTNVALSATVTGATGGFWRTASPAGRFTSTAAQIGNGLNDTYQISSSDLTAGQVILTFTGSGTSPCTPVSATKVITIIPAITGSAGPNLNLCGDITSISLTGQVFANGLLTTIVGGIWTKTVTTTGTLTQTSKFAANFIRIASTLSGVFTFTPTTTGSVFATCTSPGVSTTYTFVQPPNISISLASSGNICSDASSISLVSTVTGAPGITWSTTGTGGISNWSPDNATSSTQYLLSNADRALTILGFTANTNGAGICANKSSGIVLVTVTSKPTVIAGPSAIICDNVTEITLSGANMTLTGLSPSVLWFLSNTTGGVFLDNTLIGINGNNNNTVYQPSAQAKAGGIITLFVTVSGPGVCSGQLSSRTFTFTPAPTVNVGASTQTVCASQTVLTLVGTTTLSTNGLWSQSIPGAGNFTSNGKTAVFAVSGAGQTLSGINFRFVTTYTGCLDEFQTKFINLYPIPSITGLTGGQFCGDKSSVTLTGMSSTGSAKWYSNPSRSFGPNNATIPTVSIDVSNAYNSGITIIGVSLVSDNNGVCSPVTATSSITLTSPPVISGIVDEIYCSDVNQITFTGITAPNIAIRWSTSSNSTITGGMGTFAGTNTITTTSLNAVYKPGIIEKVAGITVFNLVTTSVPGGCLPLTATKTITYKKAPIIDPLPNRSVCSNFGPITFSANVTNEYSSVRWMSSAGNGRFDDSTSLSVTYFPKTSFEIDGAESLGQFPVNITCYVIGKDECSTSVSQTFVLTFTRKPTLSVSQIGTVCADTSGIQFGSTITGLTTAGVAWRNITNPGSLSGAFFSNFTSRNPLYILSANDLPSGLSSKTISFVVSTTGNGTCRPDIQTIDVEILPKPIITVGGIGDRYCSYTTLQVPLTFGGALFTTGEWSGSGNGSFVDFPATTATIGQTKHYQISSNDSTTGKVSFMIKSVDQNSLCKPVTALYTITLTGQPVIDVPANLRICSDVNLVTLSGNVTGPENYVYKWQFFDGDITGIFPSNSSQFLGNQGTVIAGKARDNYSITGFGSENGSFRMVLNVSSTGVCLPKTDTIVVVPQFIPNISINLPNGNRFCKDVNSIIINSALVSQVTTPGMGVIWSATNSGGQVSPSNFSPSVFDFNINYFPTTADKNSPGGISFTLSTTGNGSCGGATTIFGVTFENIPTITVTGTPIVCSNQPLVTLTGYVNTYDNATLSPAGSWKTGSVGVNAGTFTGFTGFPGSISGVASGVSQTYTISDNELANGFVNFIYTTENNGLCKSITTFLGVAINNAPEVDAGDPIMVCSATGITVTGTVYPPVTIAGFVSWSRTSGSGNLSGTILSLSTTTGVDIQNAADIFTATSGGGATLTLSATVPGCNVVKDDLIITYSSLTVLDPGTYPGICASDQIKLKPGSTSGQGVWSTTADGFFLSTGIKSTTKMDDIFRPSSTLTGSLVFVLSSLPGSGACGSPTPKTVVITLTSGMLANAGFSKLISICATDPVFFIGTVTGTQRGQWISSGTGSFSTSGSNFGNTLSGSSLVIDKYVPSINDRNSGKIILSLFAYNDGSNVCLNPVKDTLSVLFTDKPQAITKGYSRLCGNNALADGVTITGTVRLPTPNNGGDLTVHDNAARWRVLDPTNASPNIGTFVSTSLGEGFASPGLAGKTAQYAYTSLTGFNTQITVDAVYRPTAFDITRQYSGDTLTLVIESRQIDLNTNPFQITVTGTKNCSPALDTLKILFDKSPDATISGTSYSICADQDKIVLEGTIDNALGYIWSTSGVAGVAGLSPGASGPVDNLNKNKVTYFLDPAEINTTTTSVINFTLGTSSVGSCYNKTSIPISVTVNPKPGVSAGSDMTICADLSVITLNGFNTVTVPGSLPLAYKWSTNGNGSLTNSSTTPILSTVGGVSMIGVYTVTSQDIGFATRQFILSTTGPNTCKPIIRVINLNINPLPVLTTYPDQTLCRDNDVLSLQVSTQNVSTVQWAVQAVISGISTVVGTGTFTGNNITVINGPIAANSLTSVNFYPSTADKTADYLLFTIETQGTVPNTSNPLCQQIIKTTKVIYTNTPTVLLASIPGICSDQTLPVGLQATITGANDGLWSSTGQGQFSPNQTPTASDLLTGGYGYVLGGTDNNNTILGITLLVTDNGTCTKTYSVTSTLGITPIPILNAGPNDTICAITKTINFTGASATNPINIQWLTLGSGTFSGINTTSPGVWNYAFSSADSAAGVVIFELSDIGISVCNPQKVYKVIKFDTPPVMAASPFAGSGISECEDVDFITLNGSVINGFNPSWTASVAGIAGYVPGTFTPNNSSLGVNYIPGAHDLTNINGVYGSPYTSSVVTITLGAFGSGECSGSRFTSSLLVNLTPKPEIDASIIPTSICINDNKLITVTGIFNNSIAGGGIWSTFGVNGGQYLPTNVINNPGTSTGNNLFYALSSQERITGGGGLNFNFTSTNQGTCKPVTKQISLTILSAPGMNLSPLPRICETSTQLITISGLVTGIQQGIWTSSGTGGFRSTSFTSPGFGLDKPFTVVAGRTYLNDIYDPSGLDTLAGQINLILTSTVQDNNCPAVSQRVSLIFDRQPRVKLFTDAVSICSDFDVISLLGETFNTSGSIWTAQSPASGLILPSPTVPGAIYQLSAPDKGQSQLQLTLSTTDNFNVCSPDAKTLTVNINLAPTANAGNPSVCTVTSIQLNGAATNGLYTQWTTSGIGGIFSTDPFIVNPKYVPSSSDFAADSIDLTFIVYGKGNCKDSKSTINLKLDPQPYPIANAGNDEIICSGTPFGLDVTNPVNINTYAWYSPATIGGVSQLVTIAGVNQLSVNVNTPRDSSFVLEVINNRNNCVSRDTLRLQVLSLPNLGLIPIVCYNDTLILPVNQTVPLTMTGGTFQWYRNGEFMPGETRADRFKAVVPGLYTLEYTEFICSTSSSTYVRDVPHLFTRGKVICKDSPTELSPFIISIRGNVVNTYANDWVDTLPPNLVVDWRNNYNTTFNGFTSDPTYTEPSISITDSRDSAKYLVMVIDTMNNLNCSAYDTIRIKTHPKPDMTLVDVGACEGDVVRLDATPTNLETPKIFNYPPSFISDTVSASYLWQSLPDSLVATPASPVIYITKDRFGGGAYFATFSIGECIAMDTSVVTFDAAPAVMNDSIVKYCIEDKKGIILDAGAGTDYKYLWLASGNTSRNEIVYDTTKYYFKVFNKAGCSVVDSVVVKSSCNPRVYIPGAIIPDGENEKDRYFRIFGKYFTEVKLRVYNRWGEVVFSTNDIGFLTEEGRGWDGTSDGKKLPLGVYPYTLEYKGIYDEYKQWFTKRGSLTIVR